MTNKVYILIPNNITTNEVRRYFQRMTEKEGCYRSYKVGKKQKKSNIKIIDYIFSK